MATVIPFPGGVSSMTVEEPPPVPKEEYPPCVVCGARGLNDDCDCERCDAGLHEACFWGRVATLDEWRA